MSMPLVSVIIATYRRFDDFRKAIRSVLTQTYVNYELIIVDDNDDDEWNAKVAQIVHEEMYESSIPFKLIQNHPNQGSAKTRNIGINAAKGDYVCFLDDDDLYLPNRISNQVEDMISSDADYGITDLTLYNENNSVNEVRNRDYLLGNEKDDLLLCHLKYHMTGTDTLMFRRAYLLSFEGFDPIDSGDEYYLMMKAITASGQICYSPVCDVKAYVHTGEGGLSSGNSKIKGENKLFEYKKTFFNQISFNGRRYIRMRHYAVLAFAEKRRNRMLRFLSYGALSVITSPKDALCLIKTRRGG